MRTGVRGSNASSQRMAICRSILGLHRGMLWVAKKSGLAGSDWLERPPDLSALGWFADWLVSCTVVQEWTFAVTSSCPHPPDIAYEIDLPIQGDTSLKR